MKLVVVLLNVALAGFAASWVGAVRAQEDDVEAELSRAQAGENVGKLEAEAAAEPPKTKDKHELAVFHHRRGVARSRLGRYAAAVADLRAAMASYQPGRPTTNEWGQSWRIQNDLGNALADAGNWFETVEFWEDVARRYARSDVFIAHIAHGRLARYYALLGKWADAEQAMRSANALLPAMKGHPAWGRLQYQVQLLNARYNATWAEQVGNFAESERLSRLALAAGVDDIERARKSYSPEHQHYRIAVENATNARRRLARILAIRGRSGEALALAMTALQERVSRNSVRSTSVSSALAAVAHATAQDGDLQRAERYARLAIAAQQGTDVPVYSSALASRRTQLAYFLAAQGRWSESVQVHEERAKALRTNPDQRNRIGTDNRTWALGLAKIGRFEQAQAMCLRMINSQLRRPAPSRYVLAIYRATVGMARAGLGKLDAALADFRESVPEMLRDTADAAAPDSLERAFWRRTILEGYLDLLARLQEAGIQPPDLDIADEAFRTADLARGSSVQEAIGQSAARAQIVDPALAALARREQDAVNRVRVLNQLLARLTSSPQSERLDKVMRDMGAEIDRLRKEHGELTSEIRARYPEYADLINPRPVGLQNAGKALAPNEALVSIYLGESRVYVWTIGTGGKTAFRVAPLSRREVESKVGVLRRSLSFDDGNLARLPAFDLATAHELYQALLAPDAALWQNTAVLNIVPHGALAQLPFSVLVTSPFTQPAGGPQAEYQHAAWLAKSIAIAQLPSVTAFAALRRAPVANPNRTAFIGFGDPVFATGQSASNTQPNVRNLSVRKIADDTVAQLDAALKAGANASKPVLVDLPTLARGFERLGALPETADELREIAQVLKADAVRDLLLGTSATERSVKRTRLDDRKVIAFATHGLAPGELFGLDQPALVLSNPALTGDTDDDGFLTMEEVLSLKLDADWVILSACNTASADGRGSEAVSGLGRAFFYAGARSLLVSNWAVETHSARLLTTEIFRRQAADPMLTRAQALRQSMLSLMQRDAAGEQSYRYAHPAFWAPFTLVGDGGR